MECFEIHKRAMVAVFRAYPNEQSREKLPKAWKTEVKKGEAVSLGEVEGEFFPQPGDILAQSAFLHNVVPGR